MKAIKSVSVGSFALYGAVLAVFWTFVFGLTYWIMGWIFGASVLVDRYEPGQLDVLYLPDLPVGHLAQPDQRHPWRAGLVC